MPNEPSSAYNPARYDVIAGGMVVRDLVTGLEWQAGTSSQEVDASGAGRYCQQLDLGGHHDYRMPSAIELFSLVDFSIMSGLLINTSVFLNTPAVSLAEDTFLAVDYQTGEIRKELSTGLSYILRCVRSTVGATSTPRYVASGGVVTDNFTGLVWNQANDKTMIYGSSFRSSGCPSPKRVPTVKELMTLVDRTASSAPLIDISVFSAARSDDYWSVTGDNPGYAVSFTDGSIELLSMSSTASGRCLMQ